jgi:hypothetical protein
MTIKTSKSTAPAKSATKSSSKSTSRTRKTVVDNNVPTTGDLLAVSDGAAPVQAQHVELPGLDQSITGRGVFAVRTLGHAVSVEAAFLAEGGNVLRLPAVFPDREYAQSQIKELWEIVNKHFDELDKMAQEAGK